MGYVPLTNYKHLVPSIKIRESSIQNPASSIESFMQNKPNFGKDGNAPTSLLLTTNDQRLATREAQNKPKQTQFKPNTNPDPYYLKVAKNERN